MTDPAGPYSRPSSSAAAYAAQASMPPPSPRPSVTSRGSVSSLRRQAAIAASASISPPTQQPPQQPVLPHPDQLPEPSQPKFTQLFTTLTSTSNPSHRTSTHYPTVHYIFADDDPDILTEALARHSRTDPDDQSPPADRAVLLELAPSPSPSGYEVVWASSLAPDWAVVDARISRMDSSAGTLQGNPSAGSLVLEIEGVSIEPVVAPSPIPGGARQQSSSDENTADPSEGYSALVEEFEKGMGVYRRVVQATEARRRALEAAGEHGDEGEEETQMPEEETQRPHEEYDVKGKGKAVYESVDVKGKGKAVYESVDEEDEGGPHTG